jgi:hypothetical protein
MQVSVTIVLTLFVNQDKVLSNTSGTLLSRHNNLLHDAISALFTQPQPGHKFAPPVYEYPLLLVKALNIVSPIECI